MATTNNIQVVTIGVGNTGAISVNPIVRATVDSGKCIQVVDPNDPTAVYYLPLVLYDQPNPLPLVDNFAAATVFSDEFVGTPGTTLQGRVLPNGTDTSASWGIATGTWQIATPSGYAVNTTAGEGIVFFNTGTNSSDGLYWLHSDKIDRSTTYKGGLVMRYDEESGSHVRVIWDQTTPESSTNRLSAKLAVEIFDGATTTRVAEQIIEVSADNPGLDLIWVASRGQILNIWRAEGLSIPMFGGPIVLPDNTPQFSNCGLYSFTDATYTYAIKWGAITVTPLAEILLNEGGHATNHRDWTGDNTNFQISPSGQLFSQQYEDGDEIVIVDTGLTSGTTNVKIRLPMLFGAITTTDAVTNYPNVLVSVLGDPNVTDLNIPYGTQITFTGVSNPPEMNGTFVTNPIFPTILVPAGVNPASTGSSHDGTWSAAPFPYKQGLVLRYRNSINHLLAIVEYESGTNAYLKIVQVLQGTATTLASQYYAVVTTNTSSTNGYLKLEAILSGADITLNLYHGNVQNQLLASVSAETTQFLGMTNFGMYISNDHTPFEMFQWAFA